MSKVKGEVIEFEGVALPSDGSELTAEQKTALMKMTGQGEVYGSSLARLSINYKADFVVDEDNLDEDPIKLPLGKYKVNKANDDGTTTIVFAKKVSFRPFIRAYMYMVYDNAEKAYVLNSTRFKEWKDMVLDDMGNEFRAGKQYKTGILNLKPQWEKTLKIYNVVYGTVTFSGGLDMFGEPVEVVDLPCSWATKGLSFMPVAEAIQGVLDQGQMMQEHTFKLGATRNSEGENTFFVATMDLEKGRVTFGSESFSLLSDFQKTIDEENKVVIDKFNKAKEKTVDDDMGDMFGADLGDDFMDDPIPDFVAAG